MYWWFFKIEYEIWGTYTYSHTSSYLKKIEKWLQVFPSNGSTLKLSLRHIFANDIRRYNKCCTEGNSLVCSKLITCIPKVLLINIERHFRSNETNELLVNLSPIEFKETIFLDSYYSEDVIIPLSKRCSRERSYRLKALLIHHPTSSSKGHYAIFLLCSNNKENSTVNNVWILFDDRQQTISNFQFDILLNEQTQKNVVMLLYELTTDISVSKKRNFCSDSTAQLIETNDDLNAMKNSLDHGVIQYLTSDTEIYFLISINDQLQIWMNLYYKKLV